MTKAIVLIVVSVILGTIRVMGETSTLFQGVAHIFVGGLFGAWFQSINKGENWIYNQLLYGFLAISLTVLEVICFLVFKFYFGND